MKYHWDQPLAAMSWLQAAVSLLPMQIPVLSSDAQLYDSLMDKHNAQIITSVEDWR